MNETNELRCPCGDSLLPGSLATEEYVDAWLAEHAGHKASEAAPVPEASASEAPKLDLEELCRREGYASRPYAEGAVILTDEVDALVCARALRKKGFKATVTGLIVAVQEAP
jgi:hypothetical protein